MNGVKEVNEVNFHQLIGIRKCLKHSRLTGCSSTLITLTPKTLPPPPPLKKRKDESESDLATKKTENEPAPASPEFRKQSSVTIIHICFDHECHSVRWIGTWEV